ncbi:YopT-type cysteine protease domain-containing protein [Spartinivicinus poritis]|uniref:YopT-type cysteine protease domain-containing protein n=1 Tax=Spartinivicinus poritis TaxID=2994640 RepID=A0ABT5UHK8_9GAMM|nr:YopT-type cysteine protease domain-containing protein [Spartinivicinus sp. A2-2]MDE1464504.1 YopT-type cysteine protease domain-containing protein [Spartinivicinus sp. A2-2]
MSHIQGISQPQPFVVGKLSSQQSNAVNWSGRKLQLTNPQVTEKFIDGSYNEVAKASTHYKQDFKNSELSNSKLTPANGKAKKLYCRQGLLSPMLIIKRLIKKYDNATFQRFSQGGYIGDVPFGKGGICAALVMKWFGSLAHNIDFFSDIGPYYTELKKAAADGREEIFQLAINYYTDIYGGDPGHADASWNARQATDKKVLADYLADYGITDKGYLLREDQLNTDKLAACLNQPGYYDIGIYFSEGGGGHAIGVAIKQTELEKMEYRLFDPNYGELLFNDQQSLQAAVKDYISWIYPNHTGKCRVQLFT